MATRKTINFPHYISYASPKCKRRGKLFSSFADYFSALVFAIVFQSTFQNRFHLSVCTTMLKRVTKIYYHSKFLMLYINNFSRQAPQTRGRLFFNFFFKSLAKNRKIVKRIASADIDQSAMCNQYICLDRLYKIMGSFFSPFLNHFQLIEGNEYSKG